MYANLQAWFHMLFGRLLVTSFTSFNQYLSYLRTIESLSVGMKIKKYWMRAQVTLVVYLNTCISPAHCSINWWQYNRAVIQSVLLFKHRVSIVFLTKAFEKIKIHKPIDNIFRTVLFIRTRCKNNLCSAALEPKSDIITSNCNWRDICISQFIYFERRNGLLGGMVQENLA